MTLVLGREPVLDVYREAMQRKWVLPCFNSENLTTTEAILAAAKEHGDGIGMPNVPIMIGITALYEDRPQAVYYSHTRRWDVGLKLFLEELKILAGPGGPYESLRVLVHLDHILHGTDDGLLQWDLSQFSSIMYDASKLPLDDNMRATAAFVSRYGHRLLVEGACDEIGESGHDEGLALTSPDKAERYYKATGVDTIVANLGTEHRASASMLQYRGDYARAIQERIGTKLVLHGGSSVRGADMANLFADGICKANVWTLLEREASKALFAHLSRHADKVGSDIRYFTTAARQQIVFETMRTIVRDYLKMWYP